MRLDVIVQVLDCVGERRVGLHPGRLLLHQVSAICQLFGGLFQLFLNSAQHPVVDL